MRFASKTIQVRANAESIIISEEDERRVFPILQAVSLCQ